MARTCIRCGESAGKGKHYLTTKTPTATARWDFSCCDECGRLLQEATKDTIIKWRRKEVAK